LIQIEEVEDVHDLHVWSLTPGIPLLCAHVFVADGADPNLALANVTRYCQGLGVKHITLQMISDGKVCPCGRPGSQSESARGSGSFLEGEGSR